jgi:4-hydroxyphenylpyruvate dioxygenase
MPINPSNPCGLEGIEFVEFTAPDIKPLEKLFADFGFTKIGKHKSKDVTLYRQNQINFIINNEQNSFSERFRAQHGPSICALGLRVKDASHAFKESVARGARPFEGEKSGPRGRSIPAIYGIGDSLNYFCDIKEGRSCFEDDFDFITTDLKPKGKGYVHVDHLTNNVPIGGMDEWAQYYEKIFGFTEIRFFDIKGSKTGLLSRAMRSPGGDFAIPINEPTDTKSQIQEYLNEYKGSGIQHLALSTDNILESVSATREAGIGFLEIPDTYYEQLPKRVQGVREPLDHLQKLQILADGDETGYLLQIFSKNLIGPIFFEVISRKGHKGFGEGNFQALFDAMELDQERRGVL